MLEIYEIAVKLLLNSTCIQFPLFNKFKFFPLPVRNFFANCLKMKIDEQLLDSGGGKNGKISIDPRRSTTYRRSNEADSQTSIISTKRQ